MGTSDDFQPQFRWLLTGSNQSETEVWFYPHRNKKQPPRFGLRESLISQVGTPSDPSDRFSTRLLLIADDSVAQLDALVAHVHRVGARYQLTNFVLPFLAERAPDPVVLTY